MYPDASCKTEAVSDCRNETAKLDQIIFLKKKKRWNKQTSTGFVSQPCQKERQASAMTLSSLLSYPFSPAHNIWRFHVISQLLERDRQKKSKRARMREIEKAANRQTGTLGGRAVPIPVPDLILFEAMVSS